MLRLQLHNKLNALILLHGRAACFLSLAVWLLLGREASSLAVRHINYLNINNIPKGPKIIKSMISDVENQQLGFCCPKFPWR